MPNLLFKLSMCILNIQIQVVLFSTVRTDRHKIKCHLFNINYVLFILI